MKLEAQTLAKIKSRINEKVMGCCGTWIDWQYLLDAAALLAKCRYTLQVMTLSRKLMCRSILTPSNFFSILTLMLTTWRHLHGRSW